MCFRRVTSVFLRYSRHCVVVLCMAPRVHSSSCHLINARASACDRALITMGCMTQEGVHGGGTVLYSLAADLSH